MDDNIINKDFDDFLKRRYENHTIEPERALWEGIQTRLYQKKIDRSLSKVRNLKVAIASLAMIIVATFIYFEIRTQKYQPETHPISEIAKTTDSSDKSNERLLFVNTTQVKKSDSINNTSEIPSILPITESSKNKTNTDINLISPALALNMDALNYQTSPLMISGFSDSSIITETNNFKVFEKITIPKDMLHGSFKLFKPIGSVLQVIVRPVTEKPFNLQTTSSAEKTHISQKSSQNDLRLQELNQNLTQNGESGTIRSEARRLPFFIEGFVSPEISYRVLGANSQYSIPDYGKPYFNRKEKADFTFSTGISGGFGITGNIILRSGIFYSGYSLKFKTEAIHLLNNGIDGNLIYTSSGPVNLKITSSDSLSNESLIKSSLNFSYLNIPLIAELHFNNKYFINLGLNFNILVGQNINWQAEDYDGNFSNAIGDPIDELETGSVSMIVGFGTEKPISPKLSLILNPSLKIYLSTINNTAPVKSYPYAWGLNAGLRYHFN